MYSTDSALWAALRGHQVGRTVASAFYLGQQTVADLNVAQAGTLSLSVDAEVQGRASITVSGKGASLLPTKREDALATYGQEIALGRLVKVRDTEHYIPLGRYPITDADDATVRVRAGVELDWAVTLQLQDRFEAIRADDFVVATTPAASASAYSELRRLVTAFPVERNAAVADVDVPASTTYSSRIGAIQTVCTLMGAEPALTRQGAVTARKKDRWLTETVPQFTLDGVVALKPKMSKDFYNQVIVTSSTVEQLVAYASIDDPTDPLSVSRAGGRTYRYSSPLISSAEAAQSAADTILARLSRRRSRTYTVSCTPEALLLDLGDFGQVNDTLTGRSFLGEVAAMSIPLNPTQPIDVTFVVAEDL